MKKALFFIPMLVLLAYPSYALTTINAQSGTSCDFIGNCQTTIDLKSFLTVNQINLVKSVNLTLPKLEGIVNISYKFNGTTMIIYGNVNKSTYWTLDLKNGYSIDPWWNVSYQYRVQIIANTTVTMPISVNNSYGVNGSIIWTLQNNDSYIYYNETGIVPPIFIANDTDQKNWYFAGNKSGNNPYSVWDKNTVLRLHFEENTSTVTTLDMSIQKNNCTLDSQTMWVAGKIATGINTTANAGNCPDSVINRFNTTDFTICTWFKWSSTNIYQVILDKGASLGGKRIAIYTNGETGKATKNRIDWRVFDGSAGADFVSSVFVNDSAWHHTCMVRSIANDTIYGYLDGKLDNSSTDTTTTFVGVTSQWYIGSNLAGAEHFAGTVDEVQFFNYSLLASEIQKLYWLPTNMSSLAGEEYEPLPEPAEPIEPIIDNTVICFKTQPVCINLKDSTLIYKGEGYYE